MEIIELNKNGGDTMKNYITILFLQKKISLSALNRHYNYEVELNNSKYIYYEDFDHLYESGFFNYVEGLKNDLSICRQLDNKF